MPVIIVQKTWIVWKNLKSHIISSIPPLIWSSKEIIFAPIQKKGPRTELVKLQAVPKKEVCHVSTDWSRTDRTFAYASDSFSHPRDLQKSCTHCHDVKGTWFGNLYWQRPTWMSCTKAQDASKWPPWSKVPYRIISCCRVTLLQEDSARKYLDLALSVKFMWRGLYPQWCLENNYNPVSLYVYCDVFNTELNLGYHKP